MSKIIRTGRVSGTGGVTLGRHEEGLYYEPGMERQKAPTIDLAGMIAKRLDSLTGELEKEWQDKLRQEHETTRTAGERQLTEATQQHQQELERVHQERYDEGHGAGVASLEQEARDAVQRMDVLHRSMRHERDQVLLEAETLVVDLAVALARKVTQTQAQIDPKIVARTVRVALRHLSERSNLVIKVNQDDLQVASRFASAWVERIDQEAVLKVRVSDHVERGGCMIEGGEENVDARFESQLDIMQQALRAQVEDTYESDSAGDSVADTGEAAVDTADSADEPTVDEPTVDEPESES
jgi:flagellar assembly protein FliH